MSHALIDLTGKTIGNLKVIRRDADYFNKDGGATTGWWCRCVCGVERRFRGSVLRKGNLRSCGCIVKFPPRFKDITGQTLGYWSVLSLCDRNKGVASWWCRCKCGKEKRVSGARLRNGTSLSCGCIVREHGHHFRGPRVDRTGIRYGSLTVLKWDGYVEGYCDNGITPAIAWLCQCDCGNKVRVRAKHLRCAISCGCKSRPPGNSSSCLKYETLYRQLLKTAADTNRSVDITYEQFRSFTKMHECFYCYGEVVWSAYRSIDGIRHGKAYNLDRMDNSLGYSICNVVVCCKRCNMGKGRFFTFEEWYRMTECFRVDKEQGRPTVSECREIEAF
jgi:hypothetical protein